jgi:hypothetical protein
MCYELCIYLCRNCILLFLDLESLDDAVRSTKSLRCVMLAAGGGRCARLIRNLKRVAIILGAVHLKG